VDRVDPVRFVECSLILWHLLKALQEITEHHPPPSQNFEFEFRQIDETLPDYTRVMFGKTKLSPIERIMERVFVGRFNRSKTTYYEKFLGAIDKPYLNYVITRPDIPHDPLSPTFFDQHERYAVAIARQKGQLEGSILAVALQLHRVEAGNYPDSLESLVPRYIDSLPLDPFTGKAFHYENRGKDFVLYGYYYNGVDDTGVPMRGLQGDQIIHLPREEWEAVD